MKEVKVGIQVGDNHIEFDIFEDVVSFSKTLEVIIKEGEKRINKEVKDLFDSWNGGNKIK